MRQGPSRPLVGGLAAGLLLATSVAWADAGSVPPAYQAGAKTIEAISHGQATILRAFPAKAGLNGYAVQLAPGHALVMYTSKNGKYVFMGGIFDSSGKNYSVTYAHKYLPAADLPHVVSPVAMGKAVHQTTNFLIGNPTAKKSVWMVADPNCIFCHLTWEHLKPYVDKGDLKIHLIPVGFLKPSSLDKAATILENKDAAKAWRYDEAHFNVQEEEGGIIPPLPPSVIAQAKKNPKFKKALAQVEDQITAEKKAGITVPATLSPANIKAIQANNDWMNQHGISGTPFLAYRDDKGQWAVQPGMPQNTQAFVAGISGE